MGIAQELRQKATAEFDLDGYGFRVRQVNSRLVMEKGSIALAFIDIDDVKGTAAELSEEDAKLEIFHAMQRMTPTHADRVVTHQEAVIAAGVTHMRGAEGWEAVDLLTGARVGDDDGLYVSDLPPNWFVQLYDRIMTLSDKGKAALEKFRPGPGDPDAA